MSNKTFGDIPFITFYDTVLSRLAYFTSENFLPAYLDIFGPIIPENILKSINDASMDKIFDSSIYNLSKNTNIPTYTDKNTKFIDFTDMAEKINNVNIKFVNRKLPSAQAPATPPLKGGINIPNVKSIFGKNYKVAYISISTSNYGGYYILVDSRMPNCIFVVFRGTYSAKSTGSYTKPSSIVPFNIGKDMSPEQLKKKLKEDEGKMFGVLTGINKILDDVYHTIIESMMYLAKTYLEPKGSESIKVFTTGHSLGGGLCSLFANDWFETVRISPYDKAPYNIFTKKICCVSIASPRVMSPGLANNFCARVVKNEILFRRLANRGDPVPALPKKAVIGLTEGYEHPCSGKKYKTERGIISMECGSAMQVRSPPPGPVYTKSLECRNTKTSIFQGNVSGNPFAHTVYLYINFVNAVPVSQFLMSGMPSIVKSKPVEIQRNSKGGTVARIILGVGEEKSGSTNQQFKSVFFDLNNLRPKDQQVIQTNPDAKPITSEDTLMNITEFTDIIKKMKTIKPGDTLNQVIPNNVTKLAGSIEPMPKIDGLLPENSKKGGKSRKRKTKRKTYKKSSKRKHHKKNKTRKIKRR